MADQLDAEYLAFLQSITAKRARTVIQHIIEHGQITTEELKDLYGYDHPPRAARDVREAGVPLVTTSVLGKNGRQIGAYTFDPDTKPSEQRSLGRKSFAKSEKRDLVAVYGEACRVCGIKMPARALQQDHRIPYEIGGDTGKFRLEDFMLLCPSCNRSKSWTCEHCPNWVNKDPAVCATCMWASPEAYAHIATERRCQVVLNWDDDTWDQLASLQRQAQVDGTTVEDLVSKLLGGASQDR